MKYKTGLLFFLLHIFPVYAQIRPITGTVKDAETNEALSYCYVTLLNSTRGTITDVNGKFTIDFPVNGFSKLIVSYVGYKNDTVPVADGKNDYTVFLTTAKNEVNEVIVTGVSRATLIRENPLAMESVSAKQIEQTSEDNVIDAIAKNAPGFATVKTGPNVSKPFINGLGYNRVLTLYDGMRIETQQWGDEHGLPIDDYVIERAEIIDGPASMMYGSDAIAGVLSLIPAMPHDTDKVVHGRILSEYQTNNGLIGNNFRLSYANSHWSWALYGSERIARNYTDPIDGRVYNTGFKMGNATGFIEYTGQRGYSHFNGTFYDNRQGIPDGSRDSLTRRFTYQIYESQGENTLQPLVDNIKDRPLVPEHILGLYALSPLHQRIQDYRLYSDNFYKFEESDLKVSLGAEQNIRREYDHPTAPDQAGEYIVLNTADYGIRYNAPSILNIEPSFGINGMFQTNSNKNATDFPIPDYNLFEAGLYGYGKWKYNRWIVAGGIRYDHRNENGNEMYIKPNPATGFYMQVPVQDSTGGIRQFRAFRLHFMRISGSIGATCQINDNVSFKANLGRGYRAPNITEIASNGLDPGAHIYYVGNLDFVPEFNLQEDMGISGEYRDLSFSLSAFNNIIQNFIYEAQKVDESGNPVVIMTGYKTFQFQQTKAQLYGLDATMDIHPAILKGFSLNNAFSLVYGFNRNPQYKRAGVQGEYLPFIPPPRWLGSISYDISTMKKIIPMLTLKAEIDCNAAQNRYLGLYNTETPTAAYTLLNVSVHANINYTRSYVMQLELTVNNVLNTAYQSHLSRLQYFEYYTRSPNGHLGIYNMGRNICMKLIFPF